MKKLIFSAGAFLIWGMLFLGASVAKENFPQGPINVIVPFAPGGGTDVLARVVCPIWEKELGVHMSIVNKEGGNGIVGYNAMLKAPHDGYTIILGQSPNCNINVLFQNAPYKLDDFEYLFLFQPDYWMFFANKDAPWNSLAELVVDAKKRPGQIKVVLAATLSMDPIFIKEFENKAGIKFGEIISMGGGATLRREIIGGHTLLAFQANWVARPAKGLVKGLGVQMLKRSIIWPEAQTINEILPDDKKYTKEEVMLPSVIKGFAVPADLRSKYPERFEKYVRTFEKVMKSPAFADMIKRQEMEDAFEYNGWAEAKRIVNSYSKKLLEYRDFYEKKRE